MKTQGQSSERGQVLVLVVLTVVVLLGFTALAVDGGMVYSDRRFAQNAADASSLAAGGEAALYMENNQLYWGTWNCGSGGITAATNLAKTKAVNRAVDNGFVITQSSDYNNIPNKLGVATSCGTNNNGTWVEKYVDVRVQITTYTRPAFAQFVYKGPLVNTVEAVTRVRPPAPVVFGEAIVALNTANCSGNSNGVVFNGNIDVNITGGGVFSNGCLVGAGNSLDVDVISGTVRYVSQYTEQHINTFSPAPSQATGGPLQASSYLVDPPNCSLVPNYGSPSTAFAHNGSGYIPAGNYSQINVNGNIQLQGGGLYCMYGNFDTGNVDVTINNESLGVTIYLFSGSFITGGNGSVRLFAPPAGAPAPLIPGMLIYLAPGNTGLIKLRGNSTSVYHGTLLAPDGTIDVAGNPSETTPSTFYTQMIGWNVFVGGNTFIDITYDNSNPTMTNAYVDLFK